MIENPWCRRSTEFEYLESVLNSGYTSKTFWQSYLPSLIYSTFDASEVIKLRVLFIYDSYDAENLAFSSMIVDLKLVVRIVFYSQNVASSFICFFSFVMIIFLQKNQKPEKKQFVSILFSFSYLWKKNWSCRQGLTNKIK